MRVNVFQHGIDNPAGRWDTSLMKIFIFLTLLGSAIVTFGCAFDAAGLPEPAGNLNNANNVNNANNANNINNINNVNNANNANNINNVNNTNNVVEPSCDDGVPNQDETDQDCGGGACPPCADGRHCLAGADCASTYCRPDGICGAPVCDDAWQNGAETDLNCGGGTCPPCADGLSCLASADCASAYCRPDGVCGTPACDDTWQNGAETDLNCGGGTCPACANGLHCLVRSDCASRVCAGLVCQIPTCSDSTHNAYETDVDCGGFTCDPCADGLGCLQHSDCLSGFCDGGFCGAVTSCKDLVAHVPGAVSGGYTITTARAQVPVHCHIENGTAHTFAYVQGGLATRRTTDDDSCKTSGLSLFTPRTAALYALGRDVALGLGALPGGDFLGPLGIYNPHDGVTAIGSDNWCGSVYKVCCEKRMVGGGGNDTISRADCGFTSLATDGAFWASEDSDDEPSGDYDATCWLRFNYDGSGNVDTWNDQNCDYAYSSYLCMAIDDL